MKRNNKYRFLILFLCFFITACICAGEKEEKKIENAIKVVLEREMNYCNYWYGIGRFDSFVHGIKRKIIYRKGTKENVLCGENEYFVIMQLLPGDSIWNDDDCCNVIERKNAKKSDTIEKFLICVITIDEKAKNGVIGKFNNGRSSLQWCRIYLPLRDAHGNELPDAPNLPPDNPESVAYENNIKKAIRKYIFNPQNKEIYTFDFIFRGKEPEFCHDEKWNKAREIIEKGIEDGLDEENPKPEYVFILDFSIYDSELYGFMIDSKSKGPYMIEFKTINRDRRTLEINQIYVQRGLYPIPALTARKLFIYMKYGLIYKVEKAAHGKSRLVRIK